MVDIKLRQWAEQALPAKSVESGWEALQDEFKELVEKAKKSPDHDSIFDNLKSTVVDESFKRHSWEDKVCAMFPSFINNSTSYKCDFCFFSGH